MILRLDPKLHVPPRPEGIPPCWAVTWLPASSPCETHPKAWGVWRVKKTFPNTGETINHYCPGCLQRQFLNRPEIVAHPDGCHICKETE